MFFVLYLQVYLCLLVEIIFFAMLICFCAFFSLPLHGFLCEESTQVLEGLSLFLYVFINIDLAFQICFLSITITSVFLNSYESIPALSLFYFHLLSFLTMLKIGPDIFI